VQVAQSILQGVDVVKAEKDELTVKVEKLQKKIDNLKDDLKTSPLINPLAL